MAQKWAKMLHNPRILGCPKMKEDKIRIVCLSPANWGAYKWAEMLHNACIFRGPQKKEEKIRIGPQVGGNAT